MIITHNKLRKGIFIELKYYRKIEDKKGNIATLCSTLVSDSSGCVFPAFPAPWCSGWVVECILRRVGHLSSGLGWTRLTTCAPFTQVTVSHSLDYSTGLPVPAKNVPSLVKGLCFKQQ